MLKRFSSLILVLVIGSSVLAGTVRPSNEHVCKMAGIEMVPGMQMPTASLSLSPSHEMMPGMQMPTASPSLGPSHEMMQGMQMMPGMETMPCCKKHETQSVSSESGSPGQCCVNIPQETSSSGTTFNLRSPSYSIVVIHAAVVQSPLAAPKPYERSYSTEVFLPNLQASYLRNLSFLI
jgi:hypothetical protein